MSNNSITSPHNLQKIQAAASAIQVAQTAKMNRSLDQLNQISAANAHMNQEIMRGTKQLVSGQEIANELQGEANKELIRQTIAIQENIEVSKVTAAVIKEVNEAVLKGNDKLEVGNEIANNNLLQQKFLNGLTQISIDNDSLRFKIESNEKELEKLEKKYFSSMMEVIFNASEEIKEISVSEKHNIEIFFQLNSLIQSIKDAGIATDKVDDLDTKASINKLLNQTDEAMKDCLSNFNQIESEDLEDMLDILAVDEEKSTRELSQKIKENNLAILAINKEIQDLEKNVLKAQNQVNKLRPIVIENS
jgi:hypothetical protein